MTMPFRLCLCLIMVILAVPKVNAQKGWVSGLASYIETNGSKHAYFYDENFNIGHVYGTGTSFTFQELIVAGAAEPNTETGWITALYDHAGTHHVFYIDINQHLDQLYYNGTWHFQDLTASAGAPLCISMSPLTSFVDPSGAVHVAFLEGNYVNDVAQLYSANGSQWIYQNWSAGTGGSASQGTAITSLVDSSSAQHIFYTDKNQDSLDQLYYNGTFHFQRVSGVPNAVSAMSGLASGSQQIVAYMNSSYELSASIFNGSTWTVSTLTAYNTLDTQSGISVFSDQYGTHFVYSAPSTYPNQRHIHQNPNFGADQDLTLMGGGNFVAEGNSVDVLASVAGSDGEYVFYADTSHQLELLYYSFSTHSWTNKVLVTALP